MTGNTLWIEGEKGASWLQDDSFIDPSIAERACTSDISLLRLKVKHLERVAGLLEGKGFKLNRSESALAVSNGGTVDIGKIAALIRQEALDVDVVAILPCIYQG
ncbi:MAG: hypothetical protein JW950_02285 [Deltaproteobacteria bacterium]|nr:hypothetical protein [Deltaproteobacteria bacterium]